MIQVFDVPLWLGHVGDIRDLRATLAAGIAAVVDLAADEPLPHLPRDLIYCRVPLVDASGNSPHVLRLAIETTVHLLRAQIPTLVCCSAGLSRTPAISAAALSILDNCPPQHSLNRLLTLRKFDMSPALWHDVMCVLQNWV